MGAKNITTDNNQEKIMDDVSDKKVEVAVDPTELDQEKLAALKAKLSAKKMEEPMAAKIMEKKSRSINFGIVGSGQSGSRLAECFYKLGYDAVVINTAIQDLKFIEVPEKNKLFLDYGLGGAAKELEIGKAAAEAYREQIAELVGAKLGEAQVHVLTLSLGGGSGAGSCETLVDILSATGKPLVVITVLPMDSEDVQTKSNALETLSKLASMAKSKKISNLVCVDNSKIETIYKDVSQFDFFKVANKAIINPIDVFNTLSSMNSDVKPLDPAEFAKLLIDGEGLSVYGEMIVKDYVGETALAEAVMNNLDSNLLAAGFDLKQSKYVGVILTAPKAVWDKIPALYTNYALAMVNEQLGNPKGVFKGIYTVEDGTEEVKIYSWFSGLGLPDARVTQLRNETKALAEQVKNKDVQRNLNLTLDTGKSEVATDAQKIKDKIAAKSSAFGKLMGSTVDKRK